MNTVSIIGLPHDYDLLPIRAVAMLQSVGVIVLQSAKTRCAKEIMDIHAMTHKGEIQTLDDLYEQCEDFEQLYEAGAQRLATLGHDAVFGAVGDVGTNGFIRALKKRDDVEVNFVSGDGNAQQAVFFAQETADIPSWRTICARDIPGAYIETSVAMVIEGIGSARMAQDVKLKLSDYYPLQTKALFYSEHSISWKSLDTLDKLEDYDAGLAIVLPALALAEKPSYGYYDLVRIMELLRGPDGCPWDREQTHSSLRQYILEEAYETVQAIDDDDIYALYDELGDVLLQIVFHAEIGRQCGEFTERDVTSAVCEKMIKRHPHIFGDVQVSGAGDVVKNWEAIKKEEKGNETYTQVLHDIPRAMGAMMRAYKIQKKAANVGFDFGDAAAAFGKVVEETEELAQAIRGDMDARAVEAEFGDLLFAIINVLRLRHVNPETALLMTCDKFIRRFSYIEQHAGADLKKTPLHEMDALWDEAKAIFP